MITGPIDPRSIIEIRYSDGRLLIVAFERLEIENGVEEAVDNTGWRKHRLNGEVKIEILGKVLTAEDRDAVLALNRDPQTSA